jgi:hypothetical protein
MEAEFTYETSVNIYQTTLRNKWEDSHLHTRLRENMKLFWMDYLHDDFVICGMWGQTDKATTAYFKT